MKIMRKNTHETDYLLVLGEAETDEFEEKMLLHLKDSLLLKRACGIPEEALEGEDVQTAYGYDISGLKNMREALVNACLKASDLTAVLVRLNNVILTLEAHMLGDGNLLLSPDHIYMKPGVPEPLFCPVKTQEGSFEERIRPLIRELFLHADSRDTATLRMASELLRVSMGKQFRMHDLMAVIESGGKDPRPEERPVFLPAGEEDPERRLPGPEEEYLLEEEEPQPEEEDGKQKCLLFLSGIRKHLPTKKIMTAAVLVLAICLGAALLCILHPELVSRVVPAAAILAAASAGCVLIEKKPKEEGVQFEDYT